MNFIILAGGSGTRLFPLSRKNYPKQFMKLGHDLKSLFQQTIERLINYCRVKDSEDKFWIVTNENIDFTYSLN